MNVETLNCPNCGAAVSSDKTQCQFCGSRLKTMACPSCFGLMFLGSKHCSHCGAKAVQAVTGEESLGDCPRCKVKLDLLQITETNLRECKKCDGLWADIETFENICADREKQSAVLGYIGRRSPVAEQLSKITYVPCPDCKQLMNRSNFARASGVIIDLCKQHGVWFDAEELPKIIQFIRKGGLDIARKKEKLELEEQRALLREEQHKSALQDRRFNTDNSWDLDEGSGIRSFVRLLFE